MLSDPKSILEEEINFLYTLKESKQTDPDQKTSAPFFESERLISHTDFEAN